MLASCEAGSIRSVSVWENVFSEVSEMKSTLEQIQPNSKNFTSFNSQNFGKLILIRAHLSLPLKWRQNWFGDNQSVNFQAEA